MGIHCFRRSCGRHMARQCTEIYDVRGGCTPSRWLMAPWLSSPLTADTAGGRPKHLRTHQNTNQSVINGVKHAAVQTATRRCLISTREINEGLSFEWSAVRTSAETTQCWSCTDTTTRTHSIPQTIYGLEYRADSTLRHNLSLMTCYYIVLYHTVVFVFGSTPRGGDSVYLLYQNRY